MMLITDFKRNEANEVVAIVDDKEFVLSAAYVAEHKPQIGDELIVDEPAEDSVTE